MARSKTAKKLGKFIRHKRKEQGITGTELAQKAFGTSSRHSQISLIENGKVEVRTTTIDAILDVLNCEIDFKEIVEA